MSFYALNKLKNYLNTIKNDYNIELIDDIFLNDMFIKYKNFSRVYIGFDISNNFIKNIKCYLGAKNNMPDNFNENLCSVMREKSSDSSKSLYNIVFNESNFCLTEYSFSVLKKQTLNQTTPNRSVFIARFKKYHEEKINSIINNLLTITNYEYIEKDISNCVNIIKDIIHTKSHPVFIIGLNIDDDLLKSNEIKIYYDLYSFEDFEHEFGCNNFYTSICAVKKIFFETKNMIANKEYSHAIKYFETIEAIPTMFCINYRKNDSNVNKIYFVEGNKPINNKIEFLSGLHKILYNDNLTELNKEILTSALNNGFKLAEMCIALKDGKTELKIYFNLDL